MKTLMRAKDKEGVKRKPSDKSSYVYYDYFVCFVVDVVENQQTIQFNQD